MAVIRCPRSRLLADCACYEVGLVGLLFVAVRDYFHALFSKLGTS